MIVTRQQDFVFDEAALIGSIYTTGSSARQIADFLKKLGMMGIEADVIGRAIGALINYTRDDSGHCHARNVRASWCADEDGTTKVTIEFTTME